MRLAIWLALLGAGTTCALAAADTPDNAILERMKKDIFFLASDECQGRGVETKGNFLAGDYIAKQFADAGLKPGGAKGEWFQPFEIAGSAKLEGTNTLALKGPQAQETTLKIGKDFQVMGVSGSAKVTAELFFVGFGITVKDDKKFTYDDYKDTDVAGKIVVMLRHTPRWNATEKDAAFPNKDEHAGLDKKVALASTRKAAGVIIVNDATEIPRKDDLLNFDYLASASPVAIPVAQVKRNVIDGVFRSALNMSLEEIEKKIDLDLKPQSQALPGWSIAIETSAKRIAIPARNVVGVLEGNGPNAKETVVIGAHYDHLGLGGRGSREKGGGKGQIHHGADDNASGTTSILEVARRFGAMKDRQGRRLVFIAFSGEELGLLGSRHYCKEPLYSLESTVGMVNLDMVGRVSEDPKTKKEKLTIHGSGTAKGLDKLLEKINPGFQLSLKPEGTGPSDHDSFFRKSIPVVFFFSGFHDDYHKPTDTADKINLSGMKKIADYAQSITTAWADEPARPVFVKAEGKSTPTSGAKGPRLGIMPDYEEGKQGLLVGGVTPMGPASKSGVKEGDLIVEIGGRPVTNISTYMAIMGDQKAGQPVELGILRDGEKMKVQVTPQ
ncbi:MAG: M28 family peptidase [Gemmataceae bacterium]|nr:M28 family peptidase [Gemmataceae bacterium]